MDLTLKLYEVLGLSQSLKAIIDDTESDVDSVLKLKLLGIAKTIETHTVNFETIRNKKIVEYGKQLDDGTFTISAEDTKSLEKFNKDLLEILSDDVVISIDKLKSIDVFDKGVKAEFLINLYPIIEE